MVVCLIRIWIFLFFMLFNVFAVFTPAAVVPLYPTFPLLNMLSLLLQFSAKTVYKRCMIALISLRRGIFGSFLTPDLFAVKLITVLLADLRQRAQRIDCQHSHDHILLLAGSWAIGSCGISCSTNFPSSFRQISCIRVSKLPR
ncbi:hypothetical protein B0T17DRAFT_518460 [Bombardia bombarda]|uniref:Uncharacterized protein n=1 Tax=Bombardia bombarda TaxID=252184 RepID=A0AA39XLP1_9PEZI|nr:hypothetical protein B0T17DRAFT_518460 [Bombardia bombarda]